MNSTQASASRQLESAAMRHAPLVARAAVGSRSAGGRLLASGIERAPHRPTSPALKQLESDTSTFRDTIAAEHRRRSIAEFRRASAALDAWDPTLPPTEVWNPETGELAEHEHRTTAAVRETMTDALSVAKWHQGRDNGQKYRFRKLAACGSRVMIAQCKSCEGDRRAVVEGCGIARLCKLCSLRNAKKRRGRFGRARARVSTDLARIGYTRSRKKQRGTLTPGGLWSDKMITLTVPHFLLSHVAEDARIRDFGKGRAIDATMARIYAVRAAWPLFARALGRWFKLGGTLERPKKYDVPRAPIAMPLKDGTLAPPPMHRAFEWTVGGDGLGHPHFHIWLLGPKIPGETLAAMWRDALIACGVPLASDAHVVVTIQHFRDFNGAAVGELLKDGLTRQTLNLEAHIKGAPSRKTLEWSRLYKHGPTNAFEYSDGWTIADALEHARPSVVASLYKALEGSRLTQGSRGFFEADELPACTTCSAQGCWHVRFAPVPDPELEADYTERLAERQAIQQETGPP
jgi:hypothetical protein